MGGVLLAAVDQCIIGHWLGQGNIVQFRGGG